MPWFDPFVPYAARALFALPPRVQGRLAGPVPAIAAGLEPDAWLIARLARVVGGVPAGELPPAQMRERFAWSVRPLAARLELPRLRTEDAIVAGTLPARLYVPAEAGERGPLLVYYHGGGWVEGSIETHDPPCRLLAHLAGVRVLSVEYRLAPEHPFPAAADDALAAYVDVARRAEAFGADPARLAVGGDSAGGNLAAVTAQALRVEPPVAPPALQLLIYPALDMSRRHPSRLTFGEGFVLTEENMRWYEDQYVPDPARRRDPRVSPLLADDLTGLPPAHVATALADPLRDEGERYAERLRGAGVPVALQRHPHVHGFASMTAVRSGMRGVALLAGALRQGLA